MKSIFYALSLGGLLTSCDVDLKSCTENVHSSRIIENLTNFEQEITVEVSRVGKRVSETMTIEPTSKASKVDFITYTYEMQPSGKLVPQANCRNPQYLARVELLDSESEDVKLCYQEPPPHPDGEDVSSFDLDKWNSKIENNKVYLVLKSASCPEDSKDEDGFY